MIIRLADELAGRVKPVLPKKPVPVLDRKLPPKTVAMVVRIRALLEMRAPLTNIAGALKVTRSVVADVSAGRTYPDVRKPTHAEIRAAAALMAEWVIAQRRVR